MANEDQAEFWTEAAGQMWLSREEQLDQASRPFGIAAMDAANVQPGERIIDIGCGTGPTTIELASRAGSAGTALGFDISPLLIGRAREKAAEGGVNNVEFVVGDAQTAQLPGPFDLAFSRMGIMFFEDSVAAFSNIRSALTDGGRVAFTCWRDVFSNLWMSLPTLAASEVLGGFDMPPADGPSPFRFADVDVLRGVLDDAGYRNASVEQFDTTMDSPESDADESLGFILNVGPLGDQFREAEADTKRRTLDTVRAAATEHFSDGVYRLPASAWIVHASK